MPCNVPDIGWVPLAPGEPYTPWYGWGYPQGYNNLNGYYGYSQYQPAYVPVQNITYVTTIYRNVIYRNSVTYVTTNNWGSGHFTHPGFARCKTIQTGRHRARRDSDPADCGEPRIHHAPRAARSARSRVRP